MQKFIFLFILIFFHSLLFSQTEESLMEWENTFKNKTVVSLNTTPLLIQLIPFNRSNPTLFGPYNVSFARYKKKNRAFTFSLGVNLNDNDDTEELFLNIKVGWEKQKVIHKNWYYTRAWDIFLVGNSLNVPGESNNESFIIGTGPTWGIGYNFNPLVGIHIETSLLLGLDFNFGIIDFQFIPPVAVYFHVAVPRKKRNKKKS